MLVSILGQASSGTGGIPPEALVGFGAATPIVAVMAWLLRRAEQRADRLERQLLDSLRSTLPVAQEAAAALRGNTEALTAMTVEIRSSGRAGP